MYKSILRVTGLVIDRPVMKLQRLRLEEEVLYSSFGFSSLSMSSSHPAQLRTQVGSSVFLYISTTIFITAKRSILLVNAVVYGS